MRSDTCTGCLHLTEAQWRVFVVDFCGLDGDVVGFSCPLGCIDTAGCSAYERRPAWPEGAVA